ncbi:hypothetical protein B0T20DRAFT_391305 [Sordaria brevicollis]|uniref:Gfd2/YDR514C-like C-terminal domain-containing protein n=1 Tax=Sordaria brevicollis TaxID=83679 RepID=A0AAE0PGW8_SORBR|nr:hypothetical protein B0T20DRAFT_391305 [Sordaria brevicollis]
MYSSLSDDDISLASANLATRTPAPPTISSFTELQAFNETMKQTILVAIDFELICTSTNGRTELKKVSEVGIAIFDPRTVSPSPELALRDSTSSNSKFRSSSTALEDLAKTAMVVFHFLMDKWKNQTETSCPAFWHRERKNKKASPHRPRPYHCKFARSKIMPSAEAIRQLKSTIKALTIQGLTMDEKNHGEERQVRILFWDSSLEDKIFRQAGINLEEMGKNVEAWDVQSWYPFRCRFNTGSNQGKASGETAFGSLGVLGRVDAGGQSVVLHNATNDTVAQLLAFLRFQVMTEEEWVSWFDHRDDLSELSFDWVDGAIYEYNLGRMPQEKPFGKKPWGKNKNWNNRKESWQGSYQRVTQRSHRNTPGPSQTTKVEANKNHAQHNSHQNLENQKDYHQAEAVNPLGTRMSTPENDTTPATSPESTPKEIQTPATSPEVGSVAQYMANISL